jgi:transcriptional regulator with XRE-family HTH domain
MDRRSRLHTELGRAIRARREELGLSQERFAMQAQLDRTYLSGIERGERNPSLTNLARIADALGVNLGRLLEQAERSCADR